MSGRFRSVQVRRRGEVRVLLPDLRHDLGRFQVRSSFPFLAVVQRLPRDLRPAGVPVERELRHGGAEEDEDHDLDDVDMFLSPLHHSRDILEGIFIDRGVEGAGDPADLGKHLGILQPQLVELQLVLVLPLRPPLLAVDVEGESHDPGLLQLAEQLHRQSCTVRIDDGLHAGVVHLPDDLHDLGVHERVPAGDGDAVRVPEAFEDLDLLADHVHRLVTVVHILPVAAVAGQVAGRCGLQPGDGVVGKGPGESVQCTVIEDLTLGFVCHSDRDASFRSALVFQETVDQLHLER